MKNNNFIDYVKGILIYLVTTGHVIQYFFCKNNLWWENYAFKAIYMFHMPAFICVSGYLAYGSIIKYNLFDFIKSRMNRLFVPMVVWAIIGCFFGLYGNLYSDAFSLMLAFYERIFGGLWYISTLLIISVAIKLFVQYFGEINKAIVVGFIFCLAVPDKMLSSQGKFLYIFFCIGIYFYIYKNYFYFLLRNKSASIKIASIFCYVLCYIIWDRGSYINVSGFEFDMMGFGRTGLRFVSALSGCLILYFIAVYFYRANVGVFLFNIIGKKSVVLYIMQIPLFPMLGRKFGYFDIGGAIYSIVAYFVVGAFFTLLFFSASILIDKNKFVKKYFFGLN